MSYDNNQNDGKANPSKRKTEQHLPKYFRTVPNSKFLASTLDQLIQPGVVEKLNGYYGREASASFDKDDNYIGDFSNSRKNYQFEPATVIKDNLDSVKFYKDYNDYMNQLTSFNDKIKDHNITNKQEYYSWNPHINWDKFINFREYYWLPSGPQTIDVRGQSTEVVSTYTVTSADNLDNFGYVFSPDGLTQNPTIKLFRGVTYKFDINTPGLPFTIRTKRSLNEADMLSATDNLIDNQGTEEGVVTFTPTDTTPNILYYVADNSIEAAGLIKVANIEESSAIDIDAEVLGKKTYTTGAGFALSNGMKVKFVGDVIPAKYATGEYYVEGVGDKIVLINEDELTVPSAFVSNIDIDFDEQGFDRQPFDTAIGYPTIRDYMLINRSANDGNLWSRYNRWFHKSVIEQSATLNDQPVSIDESARAKRPIIEFDKGLKLFDFGTQTKTNVNLLDTHTKDVFSTIEGSTGYNIDGVDLIDGMRILFTADPDPLVNGRIFQVKFFKFDGPEIEIDQNIKQISLIEVTDSKPITNEVVLVSEGTTYKGLMYYYNGTMWKLAQTKTKVNQAPLFDMFDENNKSFSDTSVYNSSSFKGNKIFSYKEGTIGTADTEVGLILSYRTITNVGDITFKFDLLTELFEYLIGSQLYYKNTDVGFLQKYSAIATYTNENAWTKAPTDSKQPVSRQYVFDNSTSTFDVDVYENSASLADLNLTVLLNNQLKLKDVDYTIGTSVNNLTTVTFLKSSFTSATGLTIGDTVVLKTNSVAEKNDNGYYDFPSNLERNPLNNNLNEFTVGEVNNHVSSIVEDLSDFTGKFPGSSNLRDLGDVTRFGNRFVKHSSPLNLAMYSLLDKDSNLISSMRFARREYGKFKRMFLQVAHDLGWEGPTKEHVDKIMADLNKDKINSMPYYFSDMVPQGSFNKTTHIVDDNTQEYFLLSKTFSLSTASRDAVQVYLNGQQLVHNKDYTFNSEGFCRVTATKAKGELLDIYEYETTNGSYVPPTPTKLGLYPSYHPELYIDNTTQSEGPELPSGEYKFYGTAGSNQKGAGKLGWFYPLFATQAEAQAKDTELGGSGVSHIHTFVGLNKTFYMPNTGSNHGTTDAERVINEWIEGTPIIQGHDGSKIVAFKDYRDNLLLELELRIFNNIKVAYDTDLFDIHDFQGGEFRKTDFNKSAVDSPMLSDFIQWSKLVDKDYTLNDFHNRTNSWTFNYSSAVSPNGVALPGFWRAAYREAYDTDRPHTHPWEMLGFSIKPTWWETQYGPAPYTKDNLVLWTDLQNGVVRQPNKKIKILNKYKRPGLLTHLPVNENGQLLSPNDSGYAQSFDSSKLKDSFVFGDEAPVETAWRRSSEYPFSLITAWTLSQPSKVLATGFDRVNQVRNLTKQIVYKTQNNQIRLKDIVFPNTQLDSTQTFTSGLVNYIAGYMASSVVTSYTEYKENIKAITNQIGFKVGGYTDKNKFKLILDSRTPLNEGNVFVPEENYSIFLNKSSPIKTVSYSGLIIERRASGYKIKGYDDTSTTFKYFPHFERDRDPVITIGGTSEPFLEFESGRTYTVGSIVETSGKYYRVTKNHVAGSVFDESNFASMPKLPVNGGREITLRREFATFAPLELPYGSILPTIQDVCDFIQGYGKYLESVGFVFDNFRKSASVLDDWETSTKEFAFWTLHNWAEGTLISLSPGANQLKFRTTYSVVDNIFDGFFGYTLLKVDGQKLTTDFVQVDRQDPNEFILRPKNSADGIFSIKLPCVQKEHVVLLDNKTVFNDTIYDPEPGYRQERIKVLGYRTTNWNGSLNIEGFVYDQATVTNWESNKDYFIGDIVKHKEFFYTANSKIPGTETFITSQWSRLESKPESGLTANFEYKTNQFADFYDLDSDNFDSEQQRLAQHLIGYQKRKYLENIINDDVSQYKFYQGFIQDKGTKNALTKLFDVLGNADKDSLEFYEEWAIKRGQYGASAGYDEVEYKLDESKFRLSPQPIELVKSVSGEETDLVYRIPPFETYLKPKNYIHAPFPSTYIASEAGYVKDGGYVNPDDVKFIVKDFDSILNIDFATCNQGDLIWVGNDKLTWNVYRHDDTDLRVEKVTGGDTEFTVTLNSTPQNINAGDIFGVYDLISTTLDTADSTFANAQTTKAAVGAFFKVKTISLEKVTFESSDKVEDIDECIGRLSKLVSVRTDSLSNLNTIAQKLANIKSKFWVDTGQDSKWTVYENTQAFTKLQDLSSGQSISNETFAVSMCANKSNTVLAVGSPDENDGKVYIYTRGSANGNFVLSQVIAAPTTTTFTYKRFYTGATYTVGDLVQFNNIFYTVSETHIAGQDFDLAKYTILTIPPNLQKFGAAVSITEDGKYLIVGSPNASNVKTRYKANYNSSISYVQDDIVTYNNKLWKATTSIVPQSASIEFTSFGSVVQQIESIGNTTQASEQVDVILTGKYPFTGINVDHVLLKVPKLQYAGLDINDEIKLKWNTKTIANQEQTTYTDKEPFPGGGISELSSTFFSGTHQVQMKIDLILNINAFTNQPIVGDIVQTQTGSGTVAYSYEVGGSLGLYINNFTGSFSPTDSLFLSNGDFVGEYTTSAPSEALDVSSYYGGYFMITVPGGYDIFTTTSDQGKGLVYQEAITDSSVPSNYYYNSRDYETTTISSQDTIASYLETLTYQGLPGAGGATTAFLSPYFVLRAPKALTDTLSNGSNFNMFIPSLARYASGTSNDPAVIGLSYAQTNKQLTVYDLWDGYIKFGFTKFNLFGEPFEPRVGDTVRDITTGATAEVTFYQRDALNATIFVKDVVGNFSNGSLFNNNAEIEFLGTPTDPSPIYQVNRVMGEVQAKSLGLASEGIGKLIVVDSGADILLPTTSVMTDTEYWFYQENIVSGVPVVANLPSAGNNDWINVYSIPAVDGATASDYENQGMYSVFGTGTTNRFGLLNSYIVPEAIEDFYLGSEIKSAKKNDLYRLFIHAGESYSRRGDFKRLDKKLDDSTFLPGRTYFIKHGTDADSNVWDWELAKDKNFQGTYSSLVSYQTNDIIYLDGGIYKANTNLSPGIFDGANWTQQTQPIDYLGYVPNNTEILPIFDSADPSTVQDQEGLYNFSKVDVSDDGEVLIGIAKYETEKDNQVVVYRNKNGNYQRVQSIVESSFSTTTDADDIWSTNKTLWGEDIAINNDGTMIAIGEPFAETQRSEADPSRIQLDQGRVLVMKKNTTTGLFEASQTLFSRGNEKVELFGFKLSFDNNILAITAKNGDSDAKTTFDSLTGIPQTTWDNNFTTFAKKFIDTGVVYLYENIAGNLVYGQTIAYNELADSTQAVANTNPNNSIRDFGLNLYTNNSHVYVGLPKHTVFAGENGAVIDFRKDTNKNIWSTYSLPKDTVDVAKIKKVLLYNTKENKLVSYIDYLDPVQGKIPGIAEQELSYKLHYDPAVYTVGTLDVNTSNSDVWGQQQVGELWWDLSTAKFLNAYQSNTIFSVNNWNTQFTGNSIDVYEWVETILLPSEWNDMSASTEGVTEGISGTTKYDDTIYSTKRIYDDIAQTFSNRYYYWVKGRITAPNTESRKLSAFNVARYIDDPAGMGYRFINFISPTSFVLHNCEGLLKDKEVALSVQYWTIENQDINVHNQYQLYTAGLDTSKPNADIERKWFDSLIGYDDAGRIVPDPNLSAKEKYGILNDPRQSWFVNRTEALKQVIDRVNIVLKENLIVDDKIITPLLSKQEIPPAANNTYDLAVDTFEDLEFVGTAKVKQAVLTPVIVDGKIVRVTITDPGRGYKVIPKVTINGRYETAADITLTINSVGTVTAVTVNSQGSGYSSNLTTLSVRSFAVLVNSDSTLSSKWAVYERNINNTLWVRRLSQVFDVSLFWNYIDWYDTGYNEFTDINYLIDSSYQLESLDDSTGDIVKIANVGSGGWLLLEKIDNADSIDYTINYKTVGRQNGTIKFLPSLFNTSVGSGFDSASYDIKVYDVQPVNETRIILEALRDNLFVDELAVEYNNLFLSSLKYVFTEQSLVDWAFKTSFIKARHNVGDLSKKITFQNDNLPSYEEYLKEVKPFKSKLREYISDYNQLNVSANLVTDFDLPPRWDNETKTITPLSVKVIDNAIVGTDADLTTYPNKNWVDNLSYKINRVEIADAGSGYTQAPEINFVGQDLSTSETGTGATAIARLGQGGKIASIEITNKGTGYLNPPVIEVNGSIREGGTPAKLVAILGDGLVRGMHTTVKFDRVIGKFVVTKLSESQTFVGSGSAYVFDLIFPMDLKTNTVEITIAGELSLQSEYTYENIKDITKGYDRYFGRVTFTKPAANNSSIVIKYKKPIEYLTAADRVNLAYNPIAGQFGNDLSQVMDGIDYGGVEVKSFEFGGNTGWDSAPWYTDTWDTYDTTYEDEVFKLDGSTISITLSKPLENGVVYNLYRNGIRLDDPNWAPEPGYDSALVKNPNAIMQSITGDGTTTVIELQELEVPTQVDDVIIVRKETSDGSFINDPESYDTSVVGGTLAYNSATGLKSEDITVDGDGFVTPTTSKGPEEIVPGQVLDSVDISVFERPVGGSSIVVNRNYTGDGSTKSFDLGKTPFTGSSLFVKVGSDILEPTTDDSTLGYTVNYVNKTVDFEVAPANGSKINLTLVEVAGLQILDIDSFVSDGSSNNFETNVRWTDNVQGIATSNGVKLEAVFIKSTGLYPNNVELVLASPLKAGDVVRFALFIGDGTELDSFSQVVVDEFIATTPQGNDTLLLSQAPFSYGPAGIHTLVQIGDDILHSGFNQQFTVSSARDYQLDLWQIPIALIQSSQIQVYLNGRLLEYTIDWTFTSAEAFDSDTPLDQQKGNTIKIADNVGVAGDTLLVYIITESQYRFGYFEQQGDSSSVFVPTPSICSFEVDRPIGTRMKVYQFSNSTAQKFERESYQVQENTPITTGTPEYYFLNNLRAGLFKLRSPAVDSKYVWVILNNKLLLADVDYSVTTDKNFIRLVSPLSQGDRIEVLHFGNPTVITKFGFRQFKDMLNRTHYKRIDGDKNYILGKDLTPYDKTIELIDASGITNPTAGSEYPGIIFVNGERIEYRIKEGNLLKQLQRGTLGTGVKDIHIHGTEVYDQSIDSSMPYKDETISTVFTADGTSSTFDLDFTPGTGGVNEFDVFVAGKRLRKNTISSYKFETTINGVTTSSIAQDSPEGDEILSSEFSILGSTLSLLTAPSENQKVIIIRKQGKRWTDPGTALSQADTDIGRFLRATSVDLPR